MSLGFVGVQIFVAIKSLSEIRYVYEKSGTLKIFRTLTACLSER